MIIDELYKRKRVFIVIDFKINDCALLACYSFSDQMEMN